MSVSVSGRAVACQRLVFLQLCHRKQWKSETTIYISVVPFCKKLCDVIYIKAMTWIQILGVKRIEMAQLAAIVFGCDNASVKSALVEYLQSIKSCPSSFSVRSQQGRHHLSVLQQDNAASEAQAEQTPHPGFLPLCTAKHTRLWHGCRLYRSGGWGERRALIRP